MAWVLLEGIDRTGKSSVAELYKKKGYEVVHMSAPPKKYLEPGYSGTSYLDDILEMYMAYDNADVIFDRTVYGEMVWPHVYGRKPMLTDDDLEILQEFEERNSTTKILMMDPNLAAHWQRCVENKEPLDMSQFKMAGVLFNKMAHKYGFIPHQLKDYEDVKAEASKQASAANQQEVAKSQGQVQAAVSSNTPVSPKSAQSTQEETELDKLEKANAIRDVLSKRILKQKGGTFDKLEEDLKVFLKNQLSGIFKEAPTQVSLSNEEVQVLRIFVQRLKEKETKK